LPVFVFASVRINEIAWMGTANSANDEWIELYNNDSSEVNLDGWILVASDGTPNINFSNAASKIISAGGFFLLERTDDTSVPDITADLIYTGALLDGGEVLILKNSNSVEIDRVDASGGWPAGDTITDQTMQLSSSGWVTAIATPKAVNFTPPESPPSQEQSQSQSSASGDGGSSAYIPPEKLPKISADAGADKTVVVGANVEFRGQAFGLKDEPLDNARYLWIFGDGASKDGKNITHIYQYPGEYIAALNVSSGEYSASDYMLVKALPNQVFISEIKTGADSFIEFENKSKQEIDISGCQIKYNNQTFIFPQSTAIRPNAYLAIPSSISGMVFNSGKGIIEFLYSGGFKADVFNYDGILKDGQSFNRDGKSSFVGALTPGGKNSSGVSNFLSADKNPQPNAKEQKTEAQKADSEKLSKEGARQGDGINADAGVGAINLTSSKGSSKTYFIIVILAVIIFGAAAILFIRRQRGV